MKKIFATLLCCAAILSSCAQSGEGERLISDYPAPETFTTVYEGPDVVFRKIEDGLWLGTGKMMSGEALYIVEGEKKAVLIDAGTKIPGLDKIVESITDKPYDVIITHAHPDHVGACDNFDEIWIHKADAPAMAAMCPGFKGKINYLEDGDRIDLGGRILDVYHTPGHSDGSLTFVDKANKYGFSGDSFGNSHLLLFCDISTMIETCRKGLKIMKENDIEVFYNGHYAGVNAETPEKIKLLKSMCEDLLSGKVKGTKGEPGLGGDHIYSRRGTNVNYSLDKLK